MKISLVMPFKDVAAYIGQAIWSIQQQDHTDWELWAVDDHSTDQSASIVRELSKSDRRIRLLNNSGRGIIPALLVAEENIKGSFVSRMDSDDVASPDRLSRMLRALNVNGPGHVAVGYVRYFSEQGVSEGYRNYESWLNGLTARGNNFREIYKECVIPSPCWLLSKEDFDRIGGFGARDYPEDYDLCFRLHQFGFRVAAVRRILHWWRDYPERTSRNHDWYAQNSFLELKLLYFLRLDRDTNRPLTVWGAGWKGKQIAAYLRNEGVSFSWICDNPKKWGKKISGQVLLPLESFDNIPNAQTIIAVANPSAQREIRRFLSERRQREQMDFFFFC